MEGKWEITDADKAKVFDGDAVMNNTAYEVTFIPKNNPNYTSTTTMVVPEVNLGPIIAKMSDENKQKLIEKVKKLSDPEVKAKLSDPKFRNKVKEKLLNSELIKDVETKDNLKELFLTNT